MPLAVDLEMLVHQQDWQNQRPAWIVVQPRSNFPLIWQRPNGSTLDYSIAERRQQLPWPDSSMPIGS